MPSGPGTYRCQWALAMCEATAMSGVVIVAMVIGQTGTPVRWLGATASVLLAVAALIMAAGAWSVRLWVTAAPRILVDVCLAVLLVRLGVEKARRAGPFHAGGATRRGRAPGDGGARASRRRRR